MTDNRFEQIRELAMNNCRPFYDTMQVYTKASNKVYIENFRKGQLPYGHPTLEKRAYDITDRYLKIHKIREAVHG